MATIIKFLGSRFNGQPQGSLDALLELLTIERVRGDMSLTHGATFEGKRVYAGNFERVTHPFSVHSDDPEVCQALGDAIRKSLTLESYRAGEPSQRALELMRNGID